MKNSHLPLVNVDALLSLEDSLNGQTVVSHAFIYRYVQMWPQRFERIHHAVSAGHWEVALDAARSLHSSSAMAGAPRLTHESDTLVHLLKSQEHLKAARILAALRHCGDQTVAELAASYLSPEA
ncbi:Hpt domain-containing protein [Arthrobacter psychrolactophilus]